MTFDPTYVDGQRSCTYHHSFNFHPDFRCLRSQAPPVTTWTKENTRSQTPPVTTWTKENTCPTQNGHSTPIRTQVKCNILQDTCIPAVTKEGLPLYSQTRIRTRTKHQLTSIQPARNTEHKTADYTDADQPPLNHFAKGYFQQESFSAEKKTL